MVLPDSSVWSTVSGVPIDPSTGLASPRPWMAMLAKPATWRNDLPTGEFAGRLAIAFWTIVRELRRPSSGTD